MFFSLIKALKLNNNNKINNNLITWVFSFFNEKIVRCDAMLIVKQVDNLHPHYILVTQLLLAMFNF